MKANNQLVLAISTALPDSVRPIRMITGPMTTGGNKRSSKRLPCHRTNALIKKYTKDTPASPANVPDIPHCLPAAMMGAIKAKLLPKKIGTLPLVIKWKRNVPRPAVKSAVAGSRPTSKGTKTVEPKATKRNCTPTIPIRIGDKLIGFINAAKVQNSADLSVKKLQKI